MLITITANERNINTGYFFFLSETLTPQHDVISTVLVSASQPPISNTHTLPQHTLHLLLCEQRQTLVAGKETSPSTFHLNWAVTSSSPALLCHSACSSGDSPPLPQLHTAFKHIHKRQSHRQTTELVLPDTLTHWQSLDWANGWKGERTTSTWQTAGTTTLFWL